MRRSVLAALTISGVVLVGAEWAARSLLGLGDPPLIARHATIDYLFKPGTHWRFGQHIAYNSASMRAREPRVVPHPCEVRIVALGDSVLNGGVQTAQAALATTLLETSLARSLGRDVWVGNASAGGWAPGNLKAYVQHFGLFSADAVVLVVNSPDLQQTMQFARDMGPNFPTHKPVSALWEAVTRYVPRVLAMPSPATGRDGAGGRQPLRTPEAPDVAVAWILDEAARSGAITLVVHHKMRDEARPLASDDPRTGAGDRLRAIAARSNAGYLDLGIALLEPAIVEHAFRDEIHLTALGQRVLAAQVEEWLRPRLEVRLTAKPDVCRPR